MTRTKRKYNINMHYGQIIGQEVKLQNVILAELAVKLKVRTGYELKLVLERPRIFADFFWDAGIALNHNFFTDLAALHPVKKATARELELEQENADLKKENELLKSLIRR